MITPKVSIVTPSFNQAQFIEQTILSVLDQNYASLEYIIVDGGSTDGTLDILRRYETKLRWISEKDSGQANAINKGFRMSSGEILGWLNADDLYVAGALSAMVSAFAQHPEISFIYGDVLAIDHHNNAYGFRTHVKQADFEMLTYVGDYLVQPATFWRRELWTTIGELDESLHYALDYEYWMRASKRYKFLYIPVCLAKERLHTNAKTFKGSLQRLQEIEQIAYHHGGKGLPLGFHAEAVSAYTLEILKSLIRGHWHEAFDYMKKLREYHPPLGLLLRYLVVMLIFGYNGIVWVWLHLNKSRQYRKKETVFPNSQ